ERFEVSYLPPNEIMPSLDLKALKASGCQYLLMSSLHYRRYLRQPKTALVQRERIRMVFRQLRQVKKISAPSGSYGFHNPELTLLAVE
ncbi:MAG: hypothetical protein GX589_09850, partial [Deltaproteobacteria bacterium]|nr:hypothetical protein [Deltaproteobacteria bacterium]